GVPGTRARSARAVLDWGSGRASSGSSTKGARQPSKSRAISTAGAPANSRSACCSCPSAAAAGSGIVAALVAVVPATVAVTSVVLTAIAVVAVVLMTVMLVPVVLGVQCGQEVARPGLHIATEHALTQGAHPPSSLSGLHRGGLDHSRLESLDVVR